MYRKTENLSNITKDGAGLFEKSIRTRKHTALHPRISVHSVEHAYVGDTSGFI
jgi:hypothetical protein